MELNKNVALVILALAIIIALIVPSIPFTESQFYSQVTDLNYSKVKAGDYDNLGLIFDGNTLTTTSLLTDINWCVGEKDGNAVPQWDSNSNCYVNFLNKSA